MRRAVFLDRDGVLLSTHVRGGRPYPPASLAEVAVLPGVPEACRALRGAGYLLIVVTNQPDVARGTQSREVVEAIHRALRAQIPLDDIRVCFHDDADSCACRKPQPGLLLDAARAWNVDVSKSFLIGDRWRDVEAGRRAGCTSILIGDGYGEPFPSLPDRRAGSLADAAAWILQNSVPATSKERMV